MNGATSPQGRSIPPVTERRRAPRRQLGGRPWTKPAGLAARALLVLTCAASAGIGRSPVSGQPASPGRSEPAAVTDTIARVDTVRGTAGPPRPRLPDTAVPTLAVIVGLACGVLGTAMGWIPLAARAAEASSAVGEPHSHAAAVLPAVTAEIADHAIRVTHATIGRIDLGGQR